jgi:O-antigen/teichoic acid export membrane protein
MKKIIGMATERVQNLVPRAFLDFAKVLTGTVLRGLLRGVFKILVAGFLAPRAMGVLRSIYSLFRLAGSLADMGLDYAMIRFVAAAIRRDKHREKDQVLKTVLTLKVLIASGVLILGNIFAREIAIWVLCDPELTIYVRLAFLAVAGKLLWKFISSYLTAHQDFGKSAFFLMTMPFVMLIWGLFLISLNQFNLPMAIIIYLFAPAVTGLLWLPVLKREFLNLPFFKKEMIGRVLRFSRWIYLADMAASVRGQAGTLLLKNTRLSGSLSAGESAAGQYSFGSDLAGGIAMVSGALMMVLLPKASSKKTSLELKIFVRRAYMNMVILLIPLTLPLFLAKPFFLMLGHVKSSYLQYLPSLEVFVILYVGGLFAIAVMPMRTVLYAMGKPYIETYTEIIAACLIISGSILLIPEYGFNGAAMAVLIQRMISFAVLFGYGMALLRRQGLEVS